MARYYYDGARDTVEGRKKVSIFWLNKQKFIPEEVGSISYGSMSWSMNGEPTGNIRYSVCIPEFGDGYINLTYKIKGWHEPEEDYRDYDYQVDLDRVRCNLGGFRWYFKCLYCRRRVGILYMHGDYFVCRHCANLSYQSCNENKRYRYRMFRAITDEDKAYELYQEVKREYYNGKPTRKYKRYLKYSGYD